MIFPAEIVMRCDITLYWQNGESDGSDLNSIVWNVRRCELVYN